MAALAGRNQAIMYAALAFPWKKKQQKTASAAAIMNKLTKRNPDMAALAGFLVKLAQPCESEQSQSPT